MPKREAERTVQQSLLDRLIDQEPTRSADALMTRAQSVTALKHALRRDIEWLLNTRRIAEPAPKEPFEELGKSLYQFGLPDFTGLSAEAPETRDRLRRQVEETVIVFEPRLSSVRVSLLESDTVGRRELRFLIEGLLNMDPMPEHVAFDTVLETVSGRFQIRD
jgi:type VI secretion system protein ImpF